MKLKRKNLKCSWGYRSVIFGKKYLKTERKNTLSAPRIRSRWRQGNVQVFDYFILENA